MKPLLATAVCLFAIALPVHRLNAQSTTPHSSHPMIPSHAGGYLGIGVAEIDDDRARALKLPDAHGVEVKYIEQHSPAAKAGLQQGDVVLEYNGQRVEGADQFVRLVHETPANRTVHLQIFRRGAAQTLSAVIGARKSQAFNLQVPAFSMPEMPEMPEIPEAPEAAERPEAPEKPEMPEMPEMPNMPRLFELQGWSNTHLGVVAETLNPQLAEYFGVRAGVLVQKVNSGSRAERAGIKAGDVIVRANNGAISSVRDLTSVVRLAGQKHFAIVLMRNHREMTLDVKADEHLQDDSGPRENR